MFLDLSKIGEEPTSLDRDLPPCRLELQRGEFVSVHDLRCEGSAVRAEQRVELTIRIRGIADIACSRCLESFSQDLDVSARLFARNRPDPAPEAPTDPEEDDDEDEGEALVEAPGGKLDLGALVREQIYLGLPLKPVCREGCRGLCPTCGADRNRIECGCREEEIDPRLAPLLDIRRDMQGS